MNNTIFWSSVFSILLLTVGCRQQESDSDSVVTEHAGEGFNYDLVVDAETLRLWAEAGLEGEVLRTMPRGTKLKDLGQVSSFTSRIKLAGQVYDEPWIKVQTATGERGWVYARLPDFQLPAGKKSKEWQYEKRLQAYLGSEKTVALTEYQQAFQQINSLTDFANIYEQGMKLRMDLVQALEGEMSQLGMDKQPDLFWLAEVVPAFVPQLVAEGTAYYLFADYHQWLLKAQQTPAPEDDSFINFCISIFPQDSIEYFFPVWEIQTWDYGGHSLLGRGYHFTAIQTIDRLDQQGTTFSSYLQDWKQALIDDITDLKTTYWEEQPVALKELTQIVSAEFACLSRDDKIALQIRLEQFEDATKHNVKFNYKSGLD